MTAGFVQPSSSDYAGVIADLLPIGTAWPRDADSALMAWCAGCGEVWGDVVAVRAAVLLVTESDPRATLELLPEWERAWGLPDPCTAEPLSIVDRRRALVSRITKVGGQSRAFFIALAAELGYAVTIAEFSPFMAGLSRCGDTRLAAPGDPTDTDYRWTVGDPTIRYWWKVRVSGVKTRWFRAGTGQAGFDPMCRIGIATDLECVFRRYKPAHTGLQFDYSTAATATVAYTWFRAGVGHAGQDPMLTVTASGTIQDT